MLFDIIRFNQFALDLLTESEESEGDPSVANSSTPNGSTPDFQKPRHQQSIGDYLDQEGYSEAFKNDYLIPMTASVWSTSPDKASLDFPAVTLVRFMWNHYLLTAVSARAPWMTIKGGTKQYIDAVMKDFPKERVYFSTPIETLTTLDDGRIALQRENGAIDIYDHIILATHGDQAMSIIRNTATPEEESILSQFKTSVNTATLHSDLSVSSPPSRTPSIFPV